MNEDFRAVRIVALNRDGLILIYCLMLKCRIWKAKALGGFSSKRFNFSEFVQRRVQEKQVLQIQTGNHLSMCLKTSQTKKTCGKKTGLRTFGMRTNQRVMNGARIRDGNPLTFVFLLYECTSYKCSAPTAQILCLF